MSQRWRRLHYLPSSAFLVDIMWPFKSQQQRIAEFRSTHERQAADEFVRRCNLPEHPHAGAIALAVRTAIAELGSIESDYVRADSSLDDDLITLSFWGSLDTIAVVLELEQHRGVKISDDEAQRIRHPEFSSMIVADFVRAVFMVVVDKFSKLPQNG
ncbi:MAG: hypothetical protein CMJ58_26660 [Planctomycetaceae bacterium]|nr:hypothetical protein [Planctomycetaceae bacterium]